MAAQSKAAIMNHGSECQEAPIGMGEGGQGAASIAQGQQQDDGGDSQEAEQNKATGVQAQCRQPTIIVALVDWLIHSTASYHRRAARAIVQRSRARTYQIAG